MTRQLSSYRPLLALYLACLLVLAAVGAHNQARYAYHWGLTETKGELQEQLGSLRSEAAEVTGALAVRRWAHRHNMIAATEATEVTEVLSAPLPETSPPESGLEVRTVWR